MEELRAHSGEASLINTAAGLKVQNPVSDHVQKKSRRTASCEGEKFGLRISVLTQGRSNKAQAPGLTPQSCGESVHHKEGRT